MKDLKFDSTKEEDNLIGVIASMARDLGLGEDTLNTHMDLVVCHCNGCPLDFHKLVGFSVSDLAHDLAGINKHLNHDTGALENCFLPRCAK